ncbi:MAG: hypothetical protein AB7T59_04910 [Hyphomonadaceae bacterium]
MKDDPPPKKIDADYPEDVIAQRRDEVVRRMLNTPYTPQAKTRQPKAKKKKKAPAKA